ncbi:MAG: agmatine deiminase [Balneola sp.]|nr:agmatine deiminase [Balneola sp.]|tara:strand:+ start:1999 stop:3111 length:1113 start_codon:yes stop_codon:yes gene_type:complete
MESKASSFAQSNAYENTSGIDVREFGYRFPGEFEAHEATWLSWPHNPNTWPGLLNRIVPIFAEFAAGLTHEEYVHINVNTIKMAKDVRKIIKEKGGNLGRLMLHQFPTNDAWCRDHGPCFLTREEEVDSLLLLDWEYNAWGRKYSPFHLDNAIPDQIANFLAIPSNRPGIVMEGGAIETNGQGILMTTKGCLLNPNRNPHLNKQQIEGYLERFYGAKQIWWLGDGLVGDDTDGHIDDMTRFVSARTIISALESNSKDENYKALQENWERLNGFYFVDGSKPELVALPMPSPVIYQGQRLPASYANFYISNDSVWVPIFDDLNDQPALGILQDCFADKVVRGIHARELVCGLGALHCLSQQQPVSQHQIRP